MKLTHRYNLAKGLLLALSLLLWTCNTNKVSDASSIGDKNEIIVQLKGKVKPSKIVGAYQMYRVQKVKLLDKTTNTWLFAYDTSLISPDEMFRLLNNSQFATSARWPEPTN